MIIEEEEETTERLGIYGNVDYSTFLLLPLVALIFTGMTMFIVKLINAVLSV